LAAVVTILVVVAGVLAGLRSPVLKDERVAIIPPPVTTVQHAATFIPNTVATTLEATDSEPAVIWVSGLPWTPDMTEMKTRFAQLDI
jgi:hypothetical protein